MMGRKADRGADLERLAGGEPIRNRIETPLRQAVAKEPRRWRGSRRRRSLRWSRANWTRPGSTQEVEAESMVPGAAAGVPRPRSSVWTAVDSPRVGLKGPRRGRSRSPSRDPSWDRASERRLQRPGRLSGAEQLGHALRGTAAGSDPDGFPGLDSFDRPRPVARDGARHGRGALTFRNAGRPKPRHGGRLGRLVLWRGSRPATVIEGFDGSDNPKLNNSTLGACSPRDSEQTRPDKSRPADSICSPPSDRESPRFRSR